MNTKIFNLLINNLKESFNLPKYQNISFDEPGAQEGTEDDCRHRPGPLLRRRRVLDLSGRLSGGGVKNAGKAIKAIDLII